MYKIDNFCFDKYFQLFKLFVESEDKSPLVSFLSSHHLEGAEGYKDEVYKLSRSRLKYWEWTTDDIGTGKIYHAVISAIKLENNLNNLVDWRLAAKFEDKLSDQSQVEEYERAFFNFYTNNASNKDSFNIFLKHFGRTYPLIAFLFFIKDKAKYLPISSNRLDESFEKLGVVNFKTSYKCGWANYNQYLKLIKQVQVLLINEGIEDVSFLNAHSFVWILSEKGNKLENVNSESLNLQSDVNIYLKLQKKDKEAIVMARTGQGIFRGQLLQYWNRCSVTGCKEHSLLIASHIKPFKYCNDKEAIDVYNGLLLTPNIDKLFDHGLISFTDSGKIIISSQLSNADRNIFGVLNGMSIYKEFTETHRAYLEYHRRKIFKK